MSLQQQLEAMKKLLEKLFPGVASGTTKGPK